MPIAEGLTATKAALDVARTALDLLRRPKIDGEQVRNKLIEMQDLIFSAQRALGDADDENRQLRRQLDDREALKAIEADLAFQPDGGHLLRKSDGAFCCPVCWGDQRRVVPLIPGANGYYSCAIHDSSYQTKAAKEVHDKAFAEASQRAVRRRRY